MYHARPLVAVVVLSSPSSCDLVVLSKVFVVRYYRVGCLYYWRSVDVSLLQSNIAEQLEIVAIPPSDVAETQVIIFLKPYWL